MDSSHREDQTTGAPIQREKPGTHPDSRLASEKRGNRHLSSRVVPEFSELILGCRHHLFLSLVAGVTVSSSLALLALWLVAAQFEAESFVQVRQFQNAVFVPQTSRADDLTFVRSQEQVVTSPQVLNTALNDARMESIAEAIPADDAADWLRDVLRVEVQPGAEVMKISVQHPSADVARTLCNVITEAYLEETTSRLAADRQLRRQELERAAEQADRQLEVLWEELNRVASEVGADNSQSLTIRDEIQLQAYRDYAQQLRQAQLRDNELRSQLAEAQAGWVPDDTLEADVEKMLQNHPDVVASRSELSVIEARIQEMRKIAADEDSPKLRQLYEDHQRLAVVADEVLKALKLQLTEQLRRQRQLEAENRRAELRRELEQNRAEIEYLQARMAEIDTTTVRTNEKSGIRLDMARHAVDRQMRLADALAQALEEVRIESKSPPRVALIEWAELPRTPNRSRQIKAAAGMAGLGWLIVLVGIGTWEWRGCRIRSSEDARAHSDHPVYGGHASDSYRSRRRNRLPPSAVREVAASLMLSARDNGRVPTVMVSSSTEGEPRHSVSLDLARAFATLSHRTLLIDCDHTGTSLSRALGGGDAPGLLQLPPDGKHHGKYVVPTSEAFLDFLPRGTAQQPGVCVDPRILDRVLPKLRQSYDAIVIHGPSLLSTSESLLLAACADQTLLAVFKGTSRWNELMASEEVAEQAGVAIFGSVYCDRAKKCSVTLQFERRTAGVAPVSPTDTPEKSLRACVAEMQQELRQGVDVPAPVPTTSSTQGEST